MRKKSYKKFAALTAATLAASAIVPVASANVAFADVSSNDTHYEAINSLVERGIVKGFEDGTYRPNDNITRGQAAKIIAGILGLNTENVKNPGFKDIPTSHQYYGAIAALTNAGIISGYEDNTYRPGELVQRNHMAKIIANAFHLEPSADAQTPFTDLRTDYKNYITALYENKVTTGKTATTFDGASNVTRGQLASFVTRAEGGVSSNTTESFTINSVSESKIQTSEGELTISASLQSIINSANADALKGAEVTALVVDGEVKEISSLTLNAAGTANKLVVFNGNKGSINGNVIVNADYIALNNITVNGNVALTGKVLNGFSAEGLEVTGELVIDEAVSSVASLNSFAAETTTGLEITLKHSAIKNVLVKRNNVVLSSDTKLSEVNVSDVVSAIEVNADVEKVAINVSVTLAITGTGSINQLTVANKDTKIELSQNIKIAKLIVPEGSKASEVVNNYSNVRSNIGIVVDEKETKVETSNSGGSGGSSKGRNDQLSSIGNEIASAGTYGPASRTQTIEGNLTISSPDVVLRNVTITGDLILGAGIGEGDVNLQGVTVNGKTVVNGGGQNSIYFTDSILATVIVNKNTGAVRIVAQGNTQVVEVQLETPTIVVENDLEGDATGFEDITVSEAMQAVGEVQVQLEGSFETINSRATNIRINLSEATDIATLVLNAVARVEGLGNIRTARINADGSTISQRPQNLVLDTNGIVTVGEEIVSESYSDPNATTAINSVEASNGSISLEMENFVAGLTVSDFNISAKLNGEEITLNNLHFDANKQRFTFDSIPLTNNLDKTLEVTVAPNSEKVTGEAETTSFVINTGFAGRITDIQGVGIPNLRIHFRAGAGSTSGEVVETATTDEYGYYSVDLPTGIYTGEFSAQGYVTTYMLGNAVSDVFLTDQNETAIRAAASNEVKVMLSWGEYPSDLDSHLIGPDEDGTSFHVAYYNQKEVENGVTYVDLDWDDTDSYGPETTTIRRLVDGEYRFYIHNYSGNHYEFESTLRNSGAKVSVFLGNSTTPQKVFNVPTGAGEELYWIVFDLVVSNNGQNIEIKEINELQNNEFSLDKLIELANENLQSLPTVEEISVENLFEVIELVEETQEFVLMAKQAGAVDEDFVGLEDLEAVKQKISQLKEEKKAELIPTLTERLAQIPSADTITLENRTEMEELLTNIDWVLEEAYWVGIIPEELEGIENYNAAWTRIGTLYAVEYANELLAQVPLADAITVETLDEARYIVQMAIDEVAGAKWQGALDSDFIGLDKVEAALQKIEALESGNGNETPGQDQEPTPFTVSLNGDDLELTFTSPDSLSIATVDSVELLVATGDTSTISTSDVTTLFVTSDTTTVVTTDDTIKITLAGVRNELPEDSTLITVRIIYRDEEGLTYTFEASDLNLRLINN